MPYNLNIPGQVSEHQLKAIEAVASLVPKKGKVVEVGSLFGCSSWAWAKSVDPSATVYCIDPWEKNDGVRAMEARLGITYGIEQFKIHTADCPNIRALQGYSPVHFQDWADPIDLYYEDAVHTDPILAQNLEFWSGKINPTGVLCGDDYRPRFPDVMNGAQRLAERFGRELIRVDFFWCLLPPSSLVPKAAEVADRLRELGAEHDALKRKRGPMFYFGPRKPLDPVASGTSPSVVCRLSNESLDPWPESLMGPVVTSVRVTTQAEPDVVIGELRLPLSMKQLEPDMPVDFDMVLPAGTLPDGDYRLIFDLVAPDGGFAVNDTTDRAAATPLTVKASGTTGAPVSTRAYRAAALGVREPLVDIQTAIRDFTSVAFADSHGAFDRHLGAGMLYYALGHVVRSQVSVCIGSGGGFVPSLMRRAQLDAGLDPSITYLVDANLPDLAFGSPVQAGGWMTNENKFLEREKDIVVLPMLSVDAAKLLAKNGIRIDHLHIDGDHSVRGVLADLAAFLPLLSPEGIVSLHDLRMSGVNEALTAVLKSQPGLQLLDFRDIGNGTAVLRGLLDPSVARRRQTLADLADPKRRITIEVIGRDVAVTDSQHRSKFERWHYLDTSAYRQRYTLVADWIDQPDKSVVEVGGFPNSVVHVLSKAHAVHQIEPYTNPDFENEVRQAAEDKGIQAFLHPGTAGSSDLNVDAIKPFNLVALGLDISSACRTADDFEASITGLLKLMGTASRIALEVPKFHPSLVLVDHLLRILEPTIVQDITLDLSQDPVAESYHVRDGRSVRRIILMEGGRKTDIKSRKVRSLIQLAAAEMVEATEKLVEPASADYTLGTLIDFSFEGDAAPFKRGGWVGAEQKHTWMSGFESTLVMQVDDLDALGEDKVLDFVMTARPLLAPGKLESQGLVVHVNGAEVFATTVAREKVLKWQVPVALARAEAPMRIRFVHADAARPCDVMEGSTDKKLLSFAVQDLRIRS